MVVTELVDIQSIVKESDYIVFFLGAGMSAGCGIPTYEQMDSQPELFSDEKSGLSYSRLASLDMFRTNPIRVFEMHEKWVQRAERAEPHQGYLAIANVVNANRGVIVTSNVDGILARLQIDQSLLYEVHGNASMLCCQNHACEFRISSRECSTTNSFTCPYCHGCLRPDVLLFSDSQWHNREAYKWKRFCAQSRNARSPLVVIVGCGVRVPVIPPLLTGVKSRG